MQVVPYLNFDGRCAEAFRFYEQVLGGKIEVMQTFGESPMAADTPSELHHMVLHARLTVGDQMLMGSDAPAEQYEQPQGFAVSLVIESPAEAERIFHALADGGEVTAPLETTFFAARFGMLVDRFGTPWFISGGQPS